MCRRAIYRLLRENTFDADAVEAMGRAYEDLLRDVGLTDRNDPFTEIIAKEIVQVARTGVRDAGEIRAQVLAGLRDRAASSPRESG